MLQKKLLNGVEILSIEIDRLKKTIKEIAERIKLKNPLVTEVILFGSFSNGNFTPSSDVDIAIILKKGGKNFLERQDEFIDYFKEIPLDVNIAVYTEDEFNKMKKSLNSFILEIERGEVL